MFRPVKRAPKSAHICDKIAQISQYLFKKGPRLENSTPPPVVAVVTDISYGSKDNDKHQSIERSIRQGCPIVGPHYDDEDDGEDDGDDNDDDD